MTFETINQLAIHINPGNQFFVENGAWIGKVKYKDTDGIAIDIFDKEGHMMRQNVFLSYDNDCDWNIIKIKKTIAGEERWHSLTSI